MIKSIWYSLTFSIFISLFCLNICSSQDVTIGTIVNSEKSFDGYTLFAPLNSLNTYLIDNCGHLINQWESESRAGTSVYLLEDGSLVRTAKRPTSFQAGGFTGRIEIFSWEGELIWEFEYISESYHLHHDIEILPNGNILAIAWELKTEIEAIEKGKVGQIQGSNIWSEHIIEIQRGGALDKQIVWSWYLWDHLIQNSSVFLDNFGQPEDYPEKLNINFLSFQSDWIHLNAIDYNDELDQILLSSKHLSEIWIIDHSTSIEEAASSEGGLYGKGGDILYRWGNPKSYNLGSINDQMLFGQHSAAWIEKGLPLEDHIILFNNGLVESSGVILEPKILSNGNYETSDNGMFLPADFSWTYDGSPDNSFFSRSLSGIQMLPNSNVIISDGEGGRAFEVTQSGELVWDYIIPVASLVLTQGDNPIGNQIFRTERFDKDYPAFDGKDLTSQGPIELEPIDTGCSLFTSVNEQGLNLNFNIFPSIVYQTLQLDYDLPYIDDLMIINMNGDILLKQSNFSEHSLSLERLLPGMYFLRARFGKFIQIQKFIKT